MAADAEPATSRSALVFVALSILLPFTRSPTARVGSPPPRLARVAVSPTPQAANKCVRTGPGNLQFMTGSAPHVSSSGAGLSQPPTIPCRASGLHRATHVRSMSRERASAEARGAASFRPSAPVDSLAPPPTRAASCLAASPAEQVLGLQSCAGERRDQRDGGPGRVREAVRRSSRRVSGVPVMPCAVIEIRIATATVQKTRFSSSVRRTPYERAAAT